MEALVSTAYVLCDPTAVKFCRKRSEKIISSLRDSFVNFLFV